VKTLAEIAIEAGLVTKASASRAGRLAEQRKQPLVTVLIRELGVDEVALIGALRKQTRVPLLDPAQIQIDPDALRLVSRDVCTRLRVLPLQVGTDGTTKVLRVAMADPTDTSAVLELEELSHCEIEVTALPLSAIEELVEKGYKQFSTAVVQRPRPRDNLFVTSRARTPLPDIGHESEASVTAQIPLISLTSELRAESDLEARFAALCQLLVTKGVISESELADVLKKLTAKPDGASDS
jgi:hypothetical protein